MISKRYKIYKNFGKCLEISNGEIRALVTVDVGPRIIYYGCKGCNMLHEDLRRAVNKSGEFFDENFKEGEAWYLYGGHRVWKAEEDLLTYVPDNYPVRVERVENGAVFTQPVQKLTGLKLTLSVVMDDDGCLSITESFENLSDAPVKLAVWGLTVLRQGGVEIIPLNTADTGFLPHQNAVFWPYNDKKDKRLTINEKYAVLRQKRQTERPYKLGLYNHGGWAAYSYGKYLFVKKFHLKKGVFPDYQCNFETYTNNEIMEMETLSPFYELQPGETATQEEFFELYRGVSFGGFDDESVDRVLDAVKFNS